MNFAGLQLPADRNFRLFLLANVFMGVGMCIDLATFNNYYRDVFHLGVYERTFLELPRETPGFLVSVLVGILYALGDIRMAAVANALMGIGMLAFGLIPPVYAVMLCLVFVYSSGMHIYMPLANTIGLSFARDGNLGRMLGRIGGINTAALVGSTLLLMLAQFLFHPQFMITFMIGSAGFLAASICLFLMHHQSAPKFKTRWVFRRVYGLYYWLSLLYGARKQLFLTFGPWVIVDVFRQSVSTMILLTLCIAILNIGVRPLVGWLTDHKGERLVLGGEAIILFGVCLTYAFAADFLPPAVVIVVVGACFIIDQAANSVGLARATYLKKIAVDPADVSPTLSLSVSIDHIASMTIPLLGGYVWLHSGVNARTEGYKYVFIAGAVLALLNFISTRAIKIPKDTAL
jgi:hypothetical protein